MARKAQIEKVVPKTLPDDFNHWDDGEAPPPPATLPIDFDNFDETPAPPTRSSAPRVVAAPRSTNASETPVHRISATPPVRTMPVPANIASPAPKRTQELPIARGPAAVTQRNGSISLNLREATAASPTALSQPAKYVTTEELSDLVEAYNATVDEEFDVEKLRRKNLTIRWVGAIVLVLAILAAVVFLKLHKPAAQNQGVVVVRNPVVTYTPEATSSKEPSKEKPSPAKPAQPKSQTSASAQEQ